MAKTNNANTRKKTNARANNSSRTKNWKKQQNKNNFQDAAMDKEYDRGFANGEKFPQCKLTQRDTNNSPEWYYKDERVLKDVASFSFLKGLGTNLDLGKVFVPSAGANPLGSVSSVPGVMSMKIGLTAGISVDAQSPLNLAAQNVYSFVRYDNSGAANYDPPDLMLYLIAMD